MIRLTLDASHVLKSMRQSDARAFLQVLNTSRGHLDEWLRWSSALDTLDKARSWIQEFEEKESRNDGFHLGIWNGPVLAGGIICWGIHSQNKTTEVGYWLSKDQTGNGLATKGSIAVIDLLYTTFAVNRIEMQCGVDNAPSRAVAERCGLHLEGVRRESHWITDRFVDHAVYGMLRRDWVTDRNQQQ